MGFGGLKKRKIKQPKQNFALGGKNTYNRYMHCFDRSCKKVRKCFK